MSPRPGGEADKIGNRYEGAWTVARFLDVLAGQAEWIRVEPLGEVGRGIEFLVGHSDGSVEAHQAKRQFGSANEWNVSSLTNFGVFDSARRHVEAGRDYHFVSTVPFRGLQELAERARNSNDFESFIRGSLPQKLDFLFSQLGRYYGGVEVAYRLLRRFHFRLIDEIELSNSNAARADLFLEGGQGSQAKAALAELVDDNFDAELTADRILDALRPYKLSRRLAVNRQGLADRVRAEAARWLERVGRQLIHPVIPRQEADQVRGLISTPQRVHFVVAAAGGGKTAVLHQAIAGLLSDDVPTLVLRLDRYGALASTFDIGQQVGLDVSPVTALAAAADGRPSFLVVDQIDAVSLASGRLTDNFDVVSDLISEAAAIPNLHVVLGCRQFDVNNDHRIRALRERLEATVISVAPLSDEQVDAAVMALGLPVATLTRHQRDVLRLPLHVALLATIAHEPDALRFPDSQRLFDAYWERKLQTARLRRGQVRFAQVIGRLAEVISQRQELAVPISVLDAEDLADDAAVLVSEQVLVRDGTKIAFFHEAMFDYAFARQWVNRRESLVEFLTAGEQELFRRGQVRQIMTHVRAVDSARFIDEVQALLTSERIRFHIKETALAVFGECSAPSKPEADMIIGVGDAHPELQPRLWFRLRTPAWFERLDSEGRIALWLGGDEKQQERALNLMVGAAGTFPDRVAELLSESSTVPAFGAWLRRVASFSDLGISRRMFDLFVDGIRQGHYNGFDHELWLTAHGLSEQHPDWVVEVFAAALIERPDAFQRDSKGQIVALKSQDYQALELVREAATKAPREFCDTLLPYVLDVMEATAYEPDNEGQRLDAHFSIRLQGSESYGGLDSAIFSRMAAVIRGLTEAEPSEMRSTLEILALNQHESAQWLLYQGLLSGGSAYADWAATLMLQGRSRLLCGVGSNSVWTTREVLGATGPYISDELFARLEAELRDLRFSWEHGRLGWYAFTLLSALPEQRISPLGRRRLGELRRAFGMEQPTEPESFFGGWIGPPISIDAAQRMSDDNWLQAMAKHSVDRENFRTLTGGAREQAQVLRQQTQQDPARFARLALQLSPNINPAYADAILLGLGEGDPVSDEDMAFEAVRHIASFRHAENDRWLGWALRPYLRTAPLDIVELIRDRLYTSTVQNGADHLGSTGGECGRQSEIRGSVTPPDRGRLAEALADLLAYDSDGARTALAVPVLDRLLGDPSVPVRTSAARLIGAAMRHARSSATEAFWRLIEDDDELLTAAPVKRVLVFLGYETPIAVQPIVARMLVSEQAPVREVGGEFAALEAMEWGFADHLEAVLRDVDTPARKGAASVAAHRLHRTANADVAGNTLTVLSNDSSDEVRRKAGEVAGALRGHALGPFEATLKALIASPAFSDASSQLLYTLEQAPDRVDELALLCARRFVEMLGGEAADIRTGRATDAPEVGKLVIRGLAQSRTASERASLLDVLDQLLLIGAYGIDRVVSESER